MRQAEKKHQVTKGTKQPDPEMTQKLMLRSLIKKINNMHRKMENLSREMKTRKERHENDRNE
jgi:hypothetical protein